MHLELGVVGPAAAFWIQEAATVADTVVTLQGSSTGLQRWVDVMTSIASMVIALALIAIAIPLIPAAWNSRKVYRRINHVIERVEQDMNPLMRHANDVLDNLNYISTSVRMDVEQFKSTIDRTQQRLEHAAAMAEERIARFNAMLQVVQEEAEDLFVDTASTVRGFRAGSQALGRSRPAEEWDDRIEFDEEGPERSGPHRGQP